MIIDTLLSMVYGLFKPCWLTRVICTSFKETALLFNVHLSCFVNFVLGPTDNKKNRTICWMCSKLKSFWCFSYRLWPQSVWQCSLSTSNFEQVFVSIVWKTSHNVLKIQKATYLFCNKSYKAYFIQRFIIPPNWTKLWTDDHTMNILWIYVSALNLL